MTADAAHAHLRKKLRLYLVSPDGWGTQEGDVQQLRALIAAGVGAVQFRDKSDAPDRERRAARMRDICRAHGAMFVVNDDPHMARRLVADGVHVGRTDADIADARAIVGVRAIVGASARSARCARAAVESGADYLGVGAIYNAEASKPDAVTIGLGGLRAIAQDAVTARTVIVAIGGIRPDNAADCLAGGADGVAMIRGLWCLDDPMVALRGLTRCG